MTHCIDLDDVVSLGAALDWDVEQQLVHITSCETCKSRIRELQTLHEIMSEDIEPRAGFARDVVEALPMDKRSKSAVGGSVVTLVNALLAGATSFFAAALVSTGAPGFEFGVPLSFVALIAGVTTFIWNTVRTPLVL